MKKLKDNPNLEYESIEKEIAKLYDNGISTDEIEAELTKYKLDIEATQKRLDIFTICHIIWLVIICTLGIISSETENLLLMCSLPIVFLFGLVIIHRIVFGCWKFE